MAHARFSMRTYNQNKMRLRAFNKACAVFLSAALLSAQQGFFVPEVFAAVVSVPQTVNAPVGVQGAAVSGAALFTFRGGDGNIGAAAGPVSGLAGVLPSISPAGTPNIVGARPLAQEGVAVSPVGPLSVAVASAFNVIPPVARDAGPAASAAPTLRALSASSIQVPAVVPVSGKTGSFSGLSKLGRAVFGGRTEGTDAGALRQAYDGGQGSSEGGGAVQAARPGLVRSRLQKVSRVSGRSSVSAADYRALKELRQILGDGTAALGRQIEAFGFQSPSGGTVKARSAGLEGFLYSKLDLEKWWGAQAMADQLPYFFLYIEALLEPVAWAKPLRDEFKALRESRRPVLEKNAALNSLLIDTVRDLQARHAALDGASWGRSAGIYMILARAYNRMKPGKDFFESIDDSEFERIRRETGSNVIWLLDIFEIGELRRWGTGGGSPYAIRGYKVKQSLGGDAAFQDFVRRAHEAGLRVITDYIPNHQSLDSDLVKDRPEATVHIVPPQDMSDEDILRGLPRESAGQRYPYFYLVETDNYPEGGKRVHKKILVHHPRSDYGDVMWLDMAQYDHSRPEARDWQIAQARRLAERFGVDGVRRDMAYYLTNADFYGRWIPMLEEEAKSAAPWARAEIAKLVAGIKERRAARQGVELWSEFTEGVKSPAPDFFMFDEVYSHSTDMSRAGSDGLYNKNDHDASLGQVGLYDAMVSRDGGRIRAALRNAAFRIWQRGGAGLINFIGTHDGGEGNPWDKFGAVVRAAAATALLLRPVLMYNGVEQGVGQARNLKADLAKSVDREKAIPFDIPVSIDWEQEDSEKKRFLHAVLEAGDRFRDFFRYGALEVLTPNRGDAPIVAFTAGRVDEATGRQSAVLVAANFSENTAGAAFRMDRPVLKAFGAFEPRQDKTYLLTDYADRQADGSPKTYVRTGTELLRDGLGVVLRGGAAHIMEVSELEAAAHAGEGVAAAPVAVRAGRTVRSTYLRLDRR